MSRLLILKIQAKDFKKSSQPKEFFELVDDLIRLCESYQMALSYKFEIKGLSLRSYNLEIVKRIRQELADAEADEYFDEAGK